jgi:hypothetical protein
LFVEELLGQRKNLLPKRGRGFAHRTMLNNLSSSAFLSVPAHRVSHHILRDLPHTPSQSHATRSIGSRVSYVCGKDRSKLVSRVQLATLSPIKASSPAPR